MVNTVSHTVERRSHTNQSDRLFNCGFIPSRTMPIYTGRNIRQLCMLDLLGSVIFLDYKCEWYTQTTISLENHGWRHIGLQITCRVSPWRSVSQWNRNNCPSMPPFVTHPWNSVNETGGAVAATVRPTTGKQSQVVPPGVDWLVMCPLIYTGSTEARTTFTSVSSSSLASPQWHMTRPSSLSALHPQVLHMSNLSWCGFVNSRLVLI